MVGGLLLRGMLVGVVAGLLCFGFLKIAGEPSVDRAIEFESAHAAAEHAHDHQQQNEQLEPELVSRETQAGIGLFTGVVLYSAAFGGLFALGFALAYRRIGNLSPRAVSALLAALGFIVVYAVPALKYPANPPSVGDPETIGMRTTLYFGFVAVSLLAAIAVGMLRPRFQARNGAWNATLIAGGTYVVFMITVGLALPVVNEVPDGFPAVVLWQFRMSALCAQLIMWTTLGLVFGALTERAATRPTRLRATAV
jgi:predicted cobalt transporter CbtA